MIMLVHLVGKWAACPLLYAHVCVYVLERAVDLIGQFTCPKVIKTVYPSKSVVTLTMCCYIVKLFCSVCLRGEACELSQRLSYESRFES